MGCNKQKERKKLKRREQRLARHKKRRASMFMKNSVGNAPDANPSPVSGFLTSILMRGYRRKKTNTYINDYNKRVEKRKQLQDGQAAMAEENVNV